MSGSFLPVRSLGLIALVAALGACAVPVGSDPDEGTLGAPAGKADGIARYSEIVLQPEGEPVDLAHHLERALEQERNPGYQPGYIHNSKVRVDGAPTDSRIVLVMEDLRFAFEESTAPVRFEAKGDGNAFALYYRVSGADAGTWSDWTEISAGEPGTFFTSVTVEAEWKQLTVDTERTTDGWTALGDDACFVIERERTLDNRKRFPRDLVEAEQFELQLRAVETNDLCHYEAGDQYSSRIRVTRPSR
jgi:hypothetical protein